MGIRSESRCYLPSRFDTFFNCQAKVWVTFEVRLTDLEEASFYIILEAFKRRSGLCAAAGERWLFGQKGNETIRRLHTMRVCRQSTLSLIYDNAEDVTSYFFSFLVFLVSSLISYVVLN